jgi:5-(carboxyamino)imidazole ribonucleotide synthase
MREAAGRLGVPVPPFTPVATARDLEGFAHRYGLAGRAQGATGGYDGKGVWVVGSATRRPRCCPPACACWPSSTSPCAASWPPSCPLARRGRAPPGRRRDRAAATASASRSSLRPDLHEDLALEAQELALRLADELGVVGVLAVELFETDDGLLVNELAMRPHNSAHWTIEGSRTSQFEQHVRAVPRLPDGRYAADRAVGRHGQPAGRRGEPDLDRRLHMLMGRDPAVKVHLYGKQVKPGRKIGHVTALGDDLADVRRRAREGAAYLRDGVWPS